MANANPPFTDEQIQAILNMITQTNAVQQYIGARYVPLFADPIQWDSANAYEPLTIVTDQGNSYTSRQYVPVGIELGNTDFWVNTGNYNAQIEQYRQEVQAVSGSLEEIEETFVKTFDTATAMASSMELSVGMTVFTKGRFNAGDGGCAIYVIEQSSEFNGFDVIGCQSGLVAKIVDEKIINAVAYGCDPTGSSDSSNAINYAIQKARSSFNSNPWVGGVVVLYFPQGEYRVDSQITVSPLVKLKGSGTCRFITNVSGSAFKFEANEDDYHEDQSGREEWFTGDWVSFDAMIVENIASGDTVCFEIGSNSDLTSYYPTSRYTMRNFTIKGYTTGIKLNFFNNYIGTFDNFHIVCGNNNSNGIMFNGANVNSGEKFTFSNFVIEGASNYCVASTVNNFFDAYFINGAFDYNNICIGAAKSLFSLVQCRFEANNSIVGSVVGDQSVVFDDCYIGLSTADAKLVDGFTNPGTAAIANARVVFTNCLFDMFGDFDYNNNLMLAHQKAYVKLQNPSFQNLELLCPNVFSSLIDGYLLQESESSVTETTGTFIISDQTLTLVSGSVGETAQIIDEGDFKYARFTIEQPTQTTAFKVKSSAKVDGNKKYGVNFRGRGLYENFHNADITVTCYDINDNVVALPLSAGCVVNADSEVFSSATNWGFFITPPNAAKVDVETTLQFYAENLEYADYAGIYLVEF